MSVGDYSSGGGPMLRRPELKKFAAFVPRLDIGATAASPTDATAEDARVSPEEICEVARRVAVVTAVRALST